jgi:hypothetical protein
MPKRNEQALRMNAPVFIVGALRSGTSLLRLMLDHHPQVCIFGEFEYAVHWVRDDSPPPLAAYYRNLRLDRVFRAQGFEIDSSLDYSQLVESFLDQASRATGKPICGGTVHSNFHYLKRFWPDARYVHLIRDPRDVARSCIGMGWVGNVFYGTRYWLEPALRWKHLEPTLADDQKHQLKFEDLIQDPVGELTKICNFLGIAYDESMLQYPTDTTYSLPDPSLTEQWRRKLSDEEIMWVESACHSLMTEFGYLPHHSSIRPPSTIRAAGLGLQHRFSRLKRNVRVYGLPLYASWQVAKRMPHSRLQERILRKVDDVNSSRLK